MRRLKPTIPLSDSPAAEFLKEFPKSRGLSYSLRSTPTGEIISCETDSSVIINWLKNKGIE